MGSVAEWQKRSNDRFGFWLPNGRTAAQRALACRPAGCARAQVRGGSIPGGASQQHRASSTLYRVEGRAACTGVPLPVSLGPVNLASPGRI
jgi:hypothetical protein